MRTDEACPPEQEEEHEQPDGHPNPDGQGLGGSFRASPASDEMDQGGSQARQNTDEYQYDDDGREVHGGLLPGRLVGQESSPYSAVRVTGAPGKGGSFSSSPLKLAGYRFSPSLLPTAAAAAVFALLSGLGFWQLDRAAGKEERQAAFEAARGTVLDETSLDGEIREFARVHLEGRYDPSHQFLQDNRTHQGRPGYYVLTPFRISSRGAVLVNRGWVPAGPDRTALPEIAAPAGALRLRGTVRVPREDLFVLGEDRLRGGRMAEGGAAGGDRCHAAFAWLSPRRMARGPGSERPAWLRPGVEGRSRPQPGSTPGVCLSMVCACDGVARDLGRGEPEGARGMTGARRGTPARSRLVLLGLLAVFTAPLLLALLFYAGVGSWFEPETVNRGSLLDPPRPAPPGGLLLASGNALPADYLDRRWTLVHLAADGCGSACEVALQAMRQAHRALGRNESRVQRLLLLPEASPPPAETDHPVAWVTPAWRRVLRGPGREGEEGLSGTWLVDPRRFVVSYFPAGVGPRAIKDDLTRLLKLSKWQTG